MSRRPTALHDRFLPSPRGLESARVRASLRCTPSDNSNQAVSHPRRLSAPLMSNGAVPDEISTRAAKT